MTKLDSLPVAIENARHSAGNYRALAAALGLGPNGYATLQRIVTGKPVSRAAQVRVARALGVLPPPKKLHRVVMTPEQLAAWRACPAHERAARLATPLTARQEVPPC